MNGLPTFEVGAEFRRQVTATRMNFMVNGIRSAKLQPSKGVRMSESSGGTTAVPIVRRYPSRVLPPFWPQFDAATESEPGDWVVTITKGIVSENYTSSGDARIYHELLDLIDVDGNPKRFPINPGQAVYVAYGVDDDGAIRTDAIKPRIVITNDGEESSHYDPPVGGESSGTGGTVWHKLAIFEIDSDGNPIPEMFEAGDNIEHWRDLPMFVKAGGTADVFKEYDLTAGKYKTRGITAGVGITVTENADDIEIKAGGASANYFYYSRSISYADGYVNGLGRSTDPNFVICFRNGIHMGSWDTAAAAAAALGETTEEFASYATRDMLDTTTVDIP